VQKKKEGWCELIFDFVLIFEPKGMDTYFATPNKEMEKLSHTFSGESSKILSSSAILINVELL
jgi:hypothetical protein